MGKKWTEVDIYTGLVKNEDAPTNATGVNVAGTGDDSSVVVVRKKKKNLLRWTQEPKSTENIVKD